jgi:hypothetical protein
MSSENIEISTIDNKKFTISFNSELTIIKLKEEILEKMGYPVDQQRIIFIGKELENNRTLQDYNINCNSRIFVVLKLRGGMMHQSSGHNNYSLIYDSINK